MNEAALGLAELWARPVRPSRCSTSSAAAATRASTTHAAGSRVRSADLQGRGVRRSDGRGLCGRRSGFMPGRRDDARRDSDLRTARDHRSVSPPSRPAAGTTGTRAARRPERPSSSRTETTTAEASRQIADRLLGDDASSSEMSRRDLVARAPSAAARSRRGGSRSRRSDALAAPRSVHFVGIGGAGMSAIAKVSARTRDAGHRLRPQALARRRDARDARRSGARRTRRDHLGGARRRRRIGCDPANPTPSCRKRDDAASRSLSRGEALAEVLEGRRSIVVAGTHGKTTTTSMIVSVLRSAGLDPTYLVGGGLNDSGTNARNGSSDLAVAESDESDGSFLLLEPTVAVVTNIEVDHVDHWGSLDELREAFALVRRHGSRPTERSCSRSRTRVSPNWPATSRLMTFGDDGTVRADEHAPRRRWVELRSLDRRDLRVPPSSAFPELTTLRTRSLRQRRAAAVDLGVEAIAEGTGTVPGGRAPIPGQGQRARSDRHRRLCASPDGGRRDACRGAGGWLAARRRGLPTASLLAHGSFRRRVRQSLRGRRPRGAHRRVRGRARSRFRA